MPVPLSAIATKDAFVAAVGGCYEKSPWVAERAFAQGPFASVTSLAAAMKQTLANATDDEVLSLLRAHPDLAGKAALRGDVTAESAAEQAKAGLGSLTEAELSKLTSLNERYTAKFGFPFILAVRNASKRVIFAALERRMAGDLVEERAEALAQVHKIAWLRLLDSVEGNGKGFLTCHVLDVASGTPAAGMSVTLTRLGDHGDLPSSYAFTTNEDGRLDGPALKGPDFCAGAYEATEALRRVTEPADILCKCFAQCRHEFSLTLREQVVLLRLPGAATAHAIDFSAVMRPILLVVCALHASHALQAPRPQCTTSLQTPRPHRVTSLRASPPAETEEAPTAQWLASLALAGAALGPVCDNFHSAAGVLGYTKYQIALGPAPDWWGGGHLFQTAYWVPPLFALAALIIGGIDAVVSSQRPPPENLAAPSGRRVAGAVAAFVALYAFSALLATGLAPPTEALVLWPLALLLWKTNDPTLASFVAGAATAVGGPAIEVALLGGGGLFAEPFGHLYAYGRPDVLGVESWILPVYFAGGPAVALVSRWLRGRRGGGGDGNG